MKTNSSSQRDQAKNLSSISKIKPINFFIGFVLISFFTAFIIGGIIIGKDKNSKQQATTKIREQVKIDPVKLPDNPDNWKLYNIDELGAEFKLPEKLSKKDDWKVIKILGDSGSILCFSDKSIGSNGSCEGELLVIAATSKDFIKSGSEKFVYMQGFDKEGNKYSATTLSGDIIDLTGARFKEFEGGKTPGIIKILGENSGENNEPLPGTPGKGYLGAIVNTKNSNYPALIIKLNLTDDVSEYEFDQILRSINFLN